jgi:hypothetical protein
MHHLSKITLFVLLMVLMTGCSSQKWLWKDSSVPGIAQYKSAYNCCALGCEPLDVSIDSINYDGKSIWLYGKVCDKLIGDPVAYNIWRGKYHQYGCVAPMYKHNAILGEFKPGEEFKVSFIPNEQDYIIIGNLSYYPVYFDVNSYLAKHVSIPE